MSALPPVTDIARVRAGDLMRAPAIAEPSSAAAFLFNLMFQPRSKVLPQKCPTIRLTVEFAPLFWLRIMRIKAFSSRAVVAYARRRYGETESRTKASQQGAENATAHGARGAAGTR